MKMIYLKHFHILKTPNSLLNDKITTKQLRNLDEDIDIIRKIGEVLNKHQQQDIY